jgi:hypothetical protein
VGTTVAQGHHDGDEGDTGTVIAKVTVPRSIAVAAEATAPVATVIMAPKRAKKSSWKDYRWIWLKKTFDNSSLFSLLACR